MTDPDEYPERDDGDDEVAEVVDLTAARARRDPAIPDTTPDTAADSDPDTAADTPPDNPADSTPGSRTDTGGDINPDTHYEVTLDDEPSPGGMPVEATEDRDASGWLPILPSSLQNWATIKSTARRTAHRIRHITLAHTVRSPWYLVQYLFWSVIGAFRLVDRHLSWWWVTEQTTLRQHAADADDYQGWLKLHREVKATRLWRGIVITAEVTALAIAVPLLWPSAPWWAKLVVLVVLVLWLAQMGKPTGKTIVSPVVVSARFRKLNPDIVLRAYYAAGLGHPDKPDQQVQFGGPMSRDASGTGSQVVVDLPYGKGWEDVRNARGKIASGLDVSIYQVFLTPDESSHRRHLLFVADRNPLAIPAGRTPLLDCRPRDIWTAAPLGLDERGRLVTLLLLWISVLIAAQPRKGKTFTARHLALFAALDPFVHLIIADGKMSADWDKFRLVAHRYICGVVPNSRDDDPVGHLLDALREVKAHIDEVNDFLSKLSTSECPEGKLTRELSRRYKQLRVWVVVIEEFQKYFETDDQDTNKEIAKLLSDIKAAGPSAGVILISCSQKPSGVGAGDVTRLFNRYRDNHDVRFALKCGNRDVSIAALGGDAYAEGFDASTLPVGKAYLGVGILYGASDDTPTTRTYLADHADAEKILYAARRHREAAGTLTGYAAGEDIAREARDSLTDVRSVFGPGEPGLHWKTIAVRLAQRMPEYYADITPDGISALLRQHIRSVDVKVAGVGLKGARIKDIDAAIKARRTG